MKIKCRLDCKGPLRYNDVLHMTSEAMMRIWIIHGRPWIFLQLNQINKTISFQDLLALSRSWVTGIHLWFIPLPPFFLCYGGQGRENIIIIFFYSKLLWWSWHVWLLFTALSPLLGQFFRCKNWFRWSTLSTRCCASG